jgi:CRP/FNR family transcriptional regulator
MRKNIYNNYNSEDACKVCARRTNCIVFNIKKYAPSLKTINSQLFRVNDPIFRVGDHLENLYVVKSGSIKTFVTSQSGEEQILNFHGPGDVLGLDGLPFNLYSSTAISLETSSVCAVPVFKLEEVLAQIMPLWLIEFTKSRLKQENKNSYMLGKKNANTRIASFLLNMSENHKVQGCSHTEFDLSMSRDDIGNYLGLASETVSRTLTGMKKNGCVMLDRRHIKIVDTKHLQILADS